MTRKNRLQS